LSSVEKYLPEIQELFLRTQSTYIELKDIFSELEKTDQGIVYSKERIDEINERLSIIYELQKKHRVSSTKELKNILNQLSDKIFLINSLDVEIATLENLLKTEELELRNIASSISESRVKNVPVLKKKITALLNELAMPDAAFDIALKTGLPYRNDGTDSILFLFSANKGSMPDDISKVASGGELSRLMLSVKSVISHKKLLPTLIFDEIDTGISGETAVKTARIISKMGKNMQIIAITHLPQIASMGLSHYIVYKSAKAEKTITSIQKLTKEQRVKVIAEMISGQNLSDASILTAKELLDKY